MAVAAVAAAVDHAVAGVGRDFEYSGFIFVQRPEMVLLVEVGAAALRLIFSELPIAGCKQVAVLLRCHGRVQLAAGGNIAGKGKDID